MGQPATRSKLIVAKQTDDFRDVMSFSILRLKSGGPIAGRASNCENQLGSPKAFLAIHPGGMP
ncbi:MAG: hypothetical protein DCC65_05135 [Planctomycetota bacterium]|nr:MAG: hypothetical protein DCC65_05135 [Planctomycetota bacterium]